MASVAPPAVAIVTPQQQADFERWVECGQAPLRDQWPIASAALMVAAAFAWPQDQIEIFTALEQAIAASDDPAIRAEIIEKQLPQLAKGHDRIALPQSLWDAFWTIIRRPRDEFSGELDLTLAVVALGVHYDERMKQGCEASLLKFDSVKNLIATPEIRLTMDDLRRHGPETLGGELLAMLDSYGYDIEVINADDVLIEDQFVAQNRTNRRILQLHDIWHLVGGYGLTSGGELAISGFQLAQFGQNYSARFLAVVAAKTAFNAPEFLPMVYQVTFDGWRHGRAAPELIDAPWHELIGKPIAAIRKQYRMDALDSMATRMMEAMISVTPQAA